MSKIINDPVHGFIQIKFELVQRCIDHPYFQRLRSIAQLGLTHFVYPGAHHSRFHHAIGAFHLMQLALSNLRNKGIDISLEEEEGACLAILLHDIGHGPFSHTLEHKLWKKTSHEQITLRLMEKLNIEFDHKLDLAIEIFRNKYHRPFFYQLVSSQLDVDRLDYLKRDSFFSGVVEGNIGVDRILAMINVRNNQIVVEEKGIMSIQNYLLSRNLMYWQVYLHKTVMSAEFMLVKLFDRMQELKDKNQEFLISNGAIEKLMMNSINDQESNLESFIMLDDSDVWQLIKSLQNDKDYILSTLAKGILFRKLYKVHSSPQPKKDYLLKESSDIQYFEFSDQVKLTAYSTENPILILKKNGEIVNYEDFMLESGHMMTHKNSVTRTFYYSLKL